MKLIKKISALLAAVMAFSFVGMTINSKDVSADTVSVQVLTGEHIQTYGHANYWSYRISTTYYFDFILSGTPGAYVTVESQYIDRYAYMYVSQKSQLVRAGDLNYRIGADGTAKVRIGGGQFFENFVNTDGTLADGIYEFVFNGTTIWCEVRRDAGYGSYSRAVDGAVVPSPGTVSTYTPESTTYPFAKIGITNTLVVDVVKDDFAEHVGGWTTYYFQYYEPGTPTYAEPTPILSVPMKGSSMSFSANFFSGAEFVNEYGNFKPGYYKITAVDGYYPGLSNSLYTIGSAFFRVTGDIADGVYPEDNPEVPEGGLGGFVERCYTCCLGRASEPAGKAYWIHCLEGAYTGCDVAKEFFFCDEFNGLRLSNEEYVTRLYKTFMDRTPEQAGFDFWVNCLRNGSSRLDVFYGFVNSPEWRDICAIYGIRSGGVVMPVGVDISASQQAIAFVGRLYATGLGRDPEAAGLKMWAEALDRGTATGREVASNFFLGSEFTNQGVSNQEFLIRAYRIFMDRPIDIDNDPGFLYWLGQLNSGALSRADIVNTFAASDEFRAICAGAGFNA